MSFASARAVLCPHSFPSPGWLGKYLGLVRISTDIISVTVPDGCCSLGCHGYLRALLVSRVPPTRSSGVTLSAE